MIAPADPEPAPRGRAATRPSAIPWRGWRDILWRTWTGFSDEDVAMVARSIAFSVVMAVFPSLAAFVSLYGLFAEPATARDHLALLAGVAPASVLALIGDEMVRIAAGAEVSLSATFGLGLLLAIWSANTGVRSLIRGLNIVYQERETRGVLRLNATSLALTTGIFVFLLFTVAALLLGPTALTVLRIPTDLRALTVLRWPALGGLALLALAAVYRFGPNRRPARWRWLSWGATAAAMLWLTLSALLAWYMSAFATFSATYGSLGAVFGFLTWTWLSAVAVLLGAKLNAEIEHQTSVDSTIGADRPMGARGARMADTVGPPLPGGLWTRLLAATAGAWRRHRAPPGS